MGAMPACAQGIVISFGKSRAGLGDYGGGHDSPHSRQRAEDRNVAVLPWVVVLLTRRLKLVEQSFDAGTTTLALAVDQAQARQEQGDVFGGRLTPGATCSAGARSAETTSSAFRRRMQCARSSRSTRLGRKRCATLGDGASSSRVHNQGSSAAGHSLRACT